MQKEEYLIKNACYSLTKYYLCKQNNKRSLLGRKQRSQVARSFPNRYLFSFTNKVTSLFSISCILRIILDCKTAAFGTQNNRFCNTLMYRQLRNSYACEKYLHSCCLLQRYLYCRNGNKKGLQIQITVYLKTLCLDVRINLIQ